MHPVMVDLAHHTLIVNANMRAIHYQGRVAPVLWYPLNELAESGHATERKA